jgi:hypothetical protein
MVILVIETPKVLKRIDLTKSLLGRLGAHQGYAIFVYGSLILLNGFYSEL